MYLVRYSEIGVKSESVRRELVKTLIRNIKIALKERNFRIKSERGRILIESEEDINNILKRIPGIHSFSPCKKLIFSSLGELIKFTKKEYLKKIRAHTFRITARRVGEHNFTSQDLQSKLGEVLFENGCKVDLHNPEITINVEVRNNEAYFFTEVIKGMGGFPIGSGGRVVLLFSGGIDSPVASYFSLKKGCEVIFIFHNPIGESLNNKVLGVYNYIVENYCYGYIPKIYIINGRKVTERIKKDIPEKLRQIAYKRLLLKEAEEIAKKEKAFAIFTGESLSQKSSQTIKSLMLIEKDISIPVLRPLISLDKYEIMEIAREIGTIKLSEDIPEFCDISEGKASAWPNEKELENLPHIENDAKKLVREAIILKGSAVIEEEKINQFKKYVVIDVRKKQNFPLKNSKIKSNPFEIIKKRLDKKKNYILVCEQGLLAKEAARILRDKNYKAIGVSFVEYKKLIKSSSH